MMGTGCPDISQPIRQDAIFCGMAPSAQTDVWTVGRLLNWTRDWLARKQVDQPRLAAELLLAHALGCQKIELYTRFEHVPAEQQVATFRELIRQAAEHMPIAYLIGKKEFFSLEFEVSPAVLIPRPETELLAQQVIEYCRSRSQQRYDLFELGTGSGCVAIAVCKYVATAYCVASDISPEVLEVAGRNVRRHGLEERVRLVHADRLALPDGLVPAEGFDVVFANPPYVSESEWSALPRTIRQFEPKLALVAGPEGLDFYEALAGGAPAILKPGGALFVEIGCGQADKVRSLFEAGQFEHVQTWRDIGGGHERVMQFRPVRSPQAQPAPSSQASEG